MNADVKDEGVEGDEKVKAALAPAALEERILNTLAEAGVKGLGFGDLGDAISHQLEAAVGVEAWEEVDSFDLDTPIATLLKRGVVLEQEDETLTLSYGEWARLLVHESVVPITELCTAALTSLLDDPRQAKALEAEFERMLAGSNASRTEEKGVEGTTTFHALCSIPGCDHEEVRASLDLTALRTLAREARDQQPKCYACEDGARGVWAVPDEGSDDTSASLSFLCTHHGVPGANDGGTVLPDVTALASAVELLADAVEAEQRAHALAVEASLIRAKEIEELLAAFVAVGFPAKSDGEKIERIAETFRRAWEWCVETAHIAQEAQGKAETERDAAHETEVAEERARRDLTIERLQSERDADRAAFETAREGLEGDKAKLAEDLDRARRLAAARKDDLADMTRWRDETLKMVAEYDVGAAELRVRIDQLTKERDEALTAKGIATKSAETERAENERLAAEVATLKAEAAQRDAVADQAMRHFMEGAPEGMAEEVGYVPQHKTGEG